MQRCRACPARAVQGFSGAGYCTFSTSISCTPEGVCRLTTSPTRLRNRARLMGATLDLRSQPDRGTLFYVTAARAAATASAYWP